MSINTHFTSKKRSSSPTNVNTEPPLKKIHPNTSVDSQQEKSPSDKTASSHNSGSSYTSENSGAKVSSTFRTPLSSPAEKSQYSY